MRKLKFWAICLTIFMLSVTAISWIPAKLSQKGSVSVAGITDTAGVTVHTPANLFNDYVNHIYKTAGLDKASLDLNVFRRAVTGYYNFRDAKLLSASKNLITVVDFNKSSREKRLWIIDMAGKKLLYNTLVAHGQGSGDDMATNFSNTANSNQSSLGFYITNETYQGKHGTSLRLDGMDEGFNTNARNRAVVVHGADYVSQQFINTHGRLGRSWGCPALPQELTSEIINLIKDKTMLYIAGPSAKYQSAYLNESTVLKDFAEPSLQASL